MQTQTDALACFGKVPTHGDFVRFNADRPAMRALDSWLQQGLYALKSRGPARSQQAYDDSPAFRFFLRPGPDEPVVAGILQPSRDRVGRRYPLVVARELSAEEEAGAEHTLFPVTLASFFREAGDVASQLTSGELDHRTLEDVAFSGEAEGSARMTLADYRRFLDSSRLFDLIVASWGSFEDARKYLLGKNLLDVATRRPRPGGTHPGVRLPLSHAATPDGREAAFWLTVCGLFLGTDAPPMGAFWRLPERDDEPGSLVAFPAQPPVAGFSALFADAASDVVVDLLDPGSASAVAVVLAVPSWLGEMLESEQIALASFLTGLEAGMQSNQNSARRP